MKAFSSDNKGQRCPWEKKTHVGIFGNCPVDGRLFRPVGYSLDQSLISFMSPSAVGGPHSFSSKTNQTLVNVAGF